VQPSTGRGVVLNPNGLISNDVLVSCGNIPVSVCVPWPRKNV